MRTAVALLVAILLAAVSAAGQDFFSFRRSRDPRPRLATSESFDGRFNFCRLMYTRVTREAGGQGWWTDYPNADINFSIRLAELTKTRVSQLPDGEPNHLVVRPTDDQLFQCPFIIASDAGTAGFTDEEAVRLVAEIYAAPAGGSDVLVVALIVFLVLLFTDIMGYTKIFPFTRSAK